MNDSYGDAELRAMMADLESEFVERKESFSASMGKAIREVVCAFANDLGDHRRAGVLFVGAKDDGSPAGLEVSDQLLNDLAAVKDDGNILPPPTLSVRKLEIEDQSVAVIVVHPSASTPVSYRGRIWIRVGPTQRIATREDERKLVEKRRLLDVDFDALPVPTATIDDLDLLRFETDYLPRAVSRDVLEANDRGIDERLASLKMIASVGEPNPTVAGLLVLGKRPQDFIPGGYVQFLRFAGTKWSDPVIDEERCDGSVLDQIRRLDEKLSSHNRTAVDFTSSSDEIRQSTYPLEALRQLTRNAVLHRTYEGTNSQVLTYWFDDRIEIISPGAPVGGIAVESFGEPGLVAYRNPNLAEAMRVLGLVQRFGAGISTARRFLQMNGQPAPEFQVHDDRVFCTLRAWQ